MSAAQKRSEDGGNKPNQTLFVANLDDRIRKPDLRRSLYMLFATYGSILDVVALKTAKMRGQAHIVYRDIESSAFAMRALQGFEMFGKPMRISYAKGRSFIFSKLEGTFKIPGHEKEDAKVNKEIGKGLTSLQKSIFAPSQSTAAKPAPAPATPAAPAALAAPPAVTGKRQREEEDEETKDVPMDMGEDDDGGEAAMDVSDSD